jgi:hypothetical protein
MLLFMCFSSGCTQGFWVTGQCAFHRIAQVPQEMPSISNLYCLWSTSRDPSNVFA